MLKKLLSRLRLHKLFSRLLKRRRVKQSLLSRLNRLRTSALSWFEDLESRFTTRFLRAIKRPTRRPVLLGMESLEERQLLATGTVTSVSASALTLTAGQSEVLTATISSLTGSATAINSGTVQFYDNGTALGSAQTVTQASGSPNGIASLTTASLGAGTHVLTAQYSGNSTFSASSSSTYPTFNGSTNYVNQPSTGLSDFSTGFSASVWAYPTAASNWARFFDFGGQSQNIQISRNGTSNDLRFYVGGTQLVVSNAISLNNWQLFSVTVDASGNATVYKNGQQLGTSQNSGFIPTTAARTSNYIGKSNWADALYKGQMHDLQIYNTALTAAQVASINSSGTATTPNYNAPAAVVSNLVSTAMTSSTTVTVNQATSTTTTLTTSAATSTYGASVTFTATVASGATGTVTFKDGTTTLGTGTVTNGTVTYTTANLATGTHSITAAYGGDSNYLGSTGALATKLVPNNAGFESPDLGSDFWAFSYRTSNASWGFTGYAGLVVNNGGWGVAGAGTTNPDGTKSASGQAALIQYYPGETQTASISQDLTFATATMATFYFSLEQRAGNGDQRIQVLLDNTNLGYYQTSSTSAFVAMSTPSIAVSAGTHTLTFLSANQSGVDSTDFVDDVFYLTDGQTVSKATSTTALATSAATTTYGTSVTFTATVPSGATGTVTFIDGTTTLGTGTISDSTATFSTSALTAGSHSITAVYSGDGNYQGSTSSVLTQTVNQAASTTTLASSANPSTYAGSVTFTATVTNGTTGTVTFKDGSTTLGTGTISGTTATYTTSTLTGGAHSITAIYGGDGNYLGSTSSAVSQAVNQATSTTTLATSAATSTYGTSVTFTATVSSNFTSASFIGTDTTTQGSWQNVYGIQGYSIPDTATNIPASLGTLSLSNNYVTSWTKSTSEVRATQDPTNFGSRVAGVWFTPGSANGGSQSTYSMTLNLSDGNTHQLSLYALDWDSNQRTESISLTDTATGIVLDTRSLANFHDGIYLQWNVKGNVTISVTCTGPANGVMSGLFLDPSSYVFPDLVGATGTVTFKDGNTTLGTGTISGNTATYTTSTFTAGSHSITAVYVGDGNYIGSTSSAVSQTINQASSTTSLASSANPNTYGTSVTFTATVPSGATGTVTFKDGSTMLGTGTISGTTATFTTLALTGGSHSITAVYSGDGNYQGSTSSAVSQTVNKATSTTTLTTSAATSTYGTSITFTATVPRGATGTVTFKDGNTTLGTGTISGTIATYSTSALTGGSHSITAVYGGDGNYQGSTSSAVAQTVNKATSTTTLTTSAATTTYGSSVTFTATVPGDAIGTVTFKDGSTTLGTGTISGGSAT